MTLWLPYCQMQTAPLPQKVARTEGCKIILEDGRELIDGIASWWSACHGYNHPHILSEVEKQLRLMPHVMMGGLVHPQAEKLASRLVDITPEGLSRVFFSDSGSTAVEVSLKMALQYWRNKGKAHKDRFVCFTHGYHGDTLGAMSVSDPEKSMHRAFRNSVIKQYVIDIPTDEYGFAEFDSLLAGLHSNIAGLIIEPLVQGAGGMKFHSSDVLAEIHRITKKHDVLFIADEVATGFYRTGNLFACNEAGISPDLLCLGKALTGGTMGLGATLATEEIFSAFLSDGFDKAFMHGPTFMGNALACAAANASLDLFKVAGNRWQMTDIENTSDTRHLTSDIWSQRIEEIETQLREELAECESLPHVIDVRVKGAIGVVQMEPSAFDIYGLREAFIKQGVWVRPFNNIIYLTPPLVISNEELSVLCGAINKVLSSRV